ncbi:hypothetical protein D3C80_1454090 [compost metagenome]
MFRYNLRYILTRKQAPLTGGPPEHRADDPAKTAKIVVISAGEKPEISVNSLMLGFGLLNAGLVVLVLQK